MIEAVYSQLSRDVAGMAALLSTKVLVAVREQLCHQVYEVKGVVCIVPALVCCLGRQCIVGQPLRSGRTCHEAKKG